VLAGGVVALLAVVALAARSGDHDRGVPGGGLAGSAGHHAFAWVLLVIGPIAAVLGLAVFVYSQVMRRRDNEQTAALRRRRRLRTRIAVAAFVVLIAYSAATGQNPAAVLVGIFHDLFGNIHVGRLNPFNPGDAPVTQHGRARHDGGGISSVDWVVAGLTWLLIVAGTVMAVRRLRRRPDHEATALVEADDEPADTRLERLRAETDPRRAVIGAYALMDRVMADRELGRRTPEAPLEYLGRMTGAGYGRITALGRLTRLYATARFSAHPVDRDMQAEAVDAVETIAGEDPG